MEFAYKLLHFQCQCGEVPKGVEVGSTSNGYLVGLWTCSGCGKEVGALMSLEKLIAGIPEPPTATERFTDQDEVFLERGHILLNQKETET